MKRFTMFRNKKAISLVDYILSKMTDKDAHAALCYKTDIDIVPIEKKEVECLRINYYDGSNKGTADTALLVLWRHLFAVKSIRSKMKNKKDGTEHYLALPISTKIPGAVEFKPDPTFHNLIGHYFLDEEKIQDAHKHYKDASKNMEEVSSLLKGEIMHNLAFVYYNFENYKYALSRYLKGEEFFGDFIENEEAKNETKEHAKLVLTETRKNIGRAYYHLIKQQYNRNNYPEALEFIEQSINREFNLQFCHKIRGFIFVRMNRDELAIENLTTAIEMDSSEKPDTLLYHNRACAYEKLDQHELAIKDFNLVLENEPFRADSLIVRGVCYFEIGDYVSSQQDIDNGLKINPNNQVANIYKGKILEKRNELTKAKHIFESVFRKSIDPNLLPVKKESKEQEISLLLKQGDLRRARKELQVLLEFEGIGKTAKSNYLYLNSYLQSALGNQTFALKSLEAAMAIKIKTFSFLQKAIILLRQKNIEGALENINEAVTLYSKNPEELGINEIHANTLIVVTLHLELREWLKTFQEKKTDNTEVKIKTTRNDFDFEIKFTEKYKKNNPKKAENIEKRKKEGRLGFVTNMKKTGIRKHPSKGKKGYTHELKFLGKKRGKTDGKKDRIPATLKGNTLIIGK